jgi:hypothetical protein
MDSQTDERVVQTEEPITAVELNQSGQNEVNIIREPTPLATVSEAHTSMESGEHARGDEIRRQVGSATRPLLVSY